MQGDKLLEKLTTSVEKLQSSCNYELEQQDKADNLEYTNMARRYLNRPRTMMATLFIENYLQNVG